MTAGIDSASRVAADVVGLGGRTHLLQALLGALAGLLRDVGVVDGGLETSSDALLCKGAYEPHATRLRLGEQRTVVSGHGCQSTLRESSRK